MARQIPLILLKTRSQPDDTYAQIFENTGSGSSPSYSNPPHKFTAYFVPVLTHSRNVPPLDELRNLLVTCRLKDKYGGMIFTSQRAVEAWADVVNEAQHSADNTPPPIDHSQSDPFSNLTFLTRFPLYVVGPATQRALSSISIKHDRDPPARPSIYSSLNTSIHGADSGSGAVLAPFILRHYNQLYHEHYFEYFEAPRLPFIPLLGMSSQNYGRKRLESDDPRLKKKPLLFLVGETRRDIIPNTLMNAELGEKRVVVDEVEVYRTEILEGLEGDLRKLDGELDAVGGAKGVKIVVVFSPQGSEIMLRHIGWLTEDGQITSAAIEKWYKQQDTRDGDGVRWIVATIGPTTRDYLRNALGIEADLCAEQPSPEGLHKAISSFLYQHNIQI